MEPLTFEQHLVDLKAEVTTQAFDTRNRRNLMKKSYKKANKAYAARRNTTFFLDEARYLQSGIDRGQHFRRCLNLYYAMLKGRNYSEVENSVREGNEVDAFDMLAFVPNPTELATEEDLTSPAWPHFADQYWDETEQVIRWWLTT